MIDVFRGISTDIQRVCGILDEESRIESVLRGIAISQFDLISLQLPVDPVGATIATGRKVCGQLVTLETPIKIMEIAHVFLVS